MKEKEAAAKSVVVDVSGDGGRSFYREGWNEIADAHQMSITLRDAQVSVAIAASKVEDEAARL